MADPFATASDLAGLWRPLTADETPIADNLLVQASAMLRDRWPDIDDRIAAQTLDAAMAKQAVCDMAKRVMRNPDGASQRSKTTGPFTDSSSWRPGTVTDLTITRHEVDLVGGGGAKKPASSIRVRPGLW